MIQSPIFPCIAIHTASYSQSLENGIEVHKSREALAIKTTLYSLIGQFLKQDFGLVGGEALRSVIHLVITEVCPFCEKPRSVADPHNRYSFSGASKKLCGCI